jgi:hypothetical protein
LTRIGNESFSGDPASSRGGVAFFRSFVKMGDDNCTLDNDCDGADFDFSGTVDEADLAIMCDYWLKGL